MSDAIARLATAKKTARATLMVTWCNSGTLSLYGGTAPADADTAITDQTLLAEFELAATSGTAADGVFTLDHSSIDPATILADGTPTFGRITDSTDGTVGDYDAGGTGSGAAIILDNTSLVTGALVSLLGFTQTEG